MIDCIIDIDNNIKKISFAFDFNRNEHKWIQITIKLMICFTKCYSAPILVAAMRCKMSWASRCPHILAVSRNNFKCF